VDNGIVEFSGSAHELRRAASSHGHTEDVHVREVLGILRRARFLIVSCTIIIVAVTVYFTRRATPIYEATASIRVDEKQPSLPALDALQGIASTNEVTTEMAELGSRSVIEEVTEALALRVEVVRPERTSRREILARNPLAEGDRLDGERLGILGPLRERSARCRDRRRVEVQDLVSPSRESPAQLDLKGMPCVVVDDDAHRCSSRQARDQAREGTRATTWS